MATTHTLTADTLASSISYAAGDTINLGGFRLSYDTDKSSTSVILAGAGILHMKAGGGILVGGAVPATISVETDNLPIRGSLDFGCAAIVKFSAYTYLQSISRWTCPTASRDGTLWGKILHYDSATRTVTLDRDIPSLTTNDYISTFSVSTSGSDSSVLMGLSAVDHAARQVVLASAPASENLFAAGSILVLATSPLCIECTGGSGNGGHFIDGVFDGGDVLFASTVGNMFHYSNSGVTSNRMTVRRICLLPNFANSSSAGGASVPYARGKIVAGIVHCLQYASSNVNKCSSSSQIGELVCRRIFGVSESTSNPTALIYVRDVTSVLGCLSPVLAGRSFVSEKADVPDFTTSPARNTEVILGDVTQTTGGTVTRVARSSFPRDTDMADAYYFAPATASDEAWRTDTYHVRRGETLRLSIRAMRAADGASLSVEVADDFRSNVATWTLDSNAATLEWQSGHLEWTNTSERDCEVTVKLSGTGDTSGGYLRVWRATGGAM